MRNYLAFFLGTILLSMQTAQADDTLGKLIQKCNPNDPLGSLYIHIYVRPNAAYLARLMGAELDRRQILVPSSANEFKRSFRGTFGDRDFFIYTEHNDGQGEITFTSFEGSKTYFHDYTCIKQ